MAPVAANSSSVVECVSARVVGKAVSKFPDYALMNQKVVLADGSIQRTGTHALSEEGADGRYQDGGPAISTWHIGADDVFGVVTRAATPLWPVCEARTCQVYAFDDQGAMLTALKEVPRNELGTEYLGINQASLARLLDRDAKDLPAWALVVGFEGRARTPRRGPRARIAALDPRPRTGARGARGAASRTPGRWFACRGPRAGAGRGRLFGAETGT